MGFAASAALCAFGLSRFVGEVGELHDLLVIDDAFITYRYALHWAEGVGPTWNPAQAPVEGYSTPLLMALLTAGRAAFGVDVHTLSQAIGIASTLGLLAVAGALVFALTKELAWALLTAGLLAMHPLTAVWAISGMETSLYAFLITLSALLAFHAGAERSVGARVGLAVTLGLIGLTRTEGAFALIAFAIAFLGGRPNARAWRRWLPVCVGAAALIGAHFIARKLYCGLWLPLPVHNKGGAFLAWREMWSFGSRNFHLLVLAALALRAARAPGARRVVVYLALLVVLLGAIVIQVDPVMAAHDRYMFPILGALVVLAVLGLAWALRWMELPRFRWLVGVGTVAALLYAANLAHSRREPVMHTLARAEPNVLGVDRSRLHERVRNSSGGLHRGHLAVVHWLEEHAEDPRDTRIALADCGVIPFYSELEVLDLFGLNDAHIAQHGADLDYVFDAQPDYFLLAWFPTDLAIQDDPRFARDYAAVARFRGAYTLTLYERWAQPTGVDRVGTSVARSGRTRGRKSP